MGSASADGSLKVWDCTNLKKGSVTQSGGLNCTHFFKAAHEGMVVRKLIFHSLVKGQDKKAETDLLWVISSGDDCVIRIWDLIKNTCIKEMKDHLSVVPTLMIHDDYLITAGRDKVLNLWNMKMLYNSSSTGKFLLGTVPTFESMEGAAVIIPSDTLKQSFQKPKVSSFVIATGGELGKLRIFDLFSNPSLIYEEDNGDDAVRKTRSVLPQYLQLM